MSDPNPTCAQLPVTTEPDYLRDRLTQAITAGIRRADDQARKPHTVFAGDAERYAPYVADALAPVLAQLPAGAVDTLGTPPARLSPTGVLLAFEGGEGAGKSTHADMTPFTQSNSERVKSWGWLATRQ